MRRTIALMAFGLLLMGLVATPTVASAAPTKPNIVLILTDDQRWDELENMPKVKSLLADEGVTFTQAFVPNSLCCPSRATTLTGQYSSRNGVWTNGYTAARPWGGFRAFKPHESQTLAVWLHDAGYRTGLAGKYMNQYTSTAAKTAADPTGLQPRQGWDYWHTFVNDTNDSEPPAYYNYQADDQGSVTTHGSAPTDYSTNVFGDDAVQFVNSTPANQPFFLYFAPYGPHSPFTPAPQDTNALPNCTGGQTPPGCYKKMQIAAPGACPVQTGLAPFCSENIGEADVSDKPAWVQTLTATGTGWDSKRKLQEQTLLSIDREVGDLVAAVQARGEMSDTMFVFTSDNSLSGGSHRWTAKESPWDEAIHVPMVVRYDPLTAGLTDRVENTHMVMNTDFAQTMLDLAGITPPSGYTFDGQSWLPLLTSPNTSGVPGRSIPIEHLQKGDTVNPPSYCGVRTEGDPLLPTLTGAWKYVRYQDGETELYNLTADPFELQNLSSNPAYATELGSLATRAQQLCTPGPPGYQWPAGTPPELVQSRASAVTAATNPNVSASLPNDTVAGNTLVDVITFPGAATVTTPPPGFTLGSSSSNVFIYYQANAPALAAGTAITAHLSVASGWTSTLLEYSGLADSPADASGHYSSNSLTVTTLNSGKSSATSQPSELVIGAFTDAAGTPITGGSLSAGFTMRQTPAANGGKNWTGVFDRVVSNSGMYQATGTTSAPSKVRGAILTLRAA
jgi:N-acetylglucosamine-6-sulfatase